MAAGARRRHADRMIETRLDPRSRAAGTGWPRRDAPGARKRQANGYMRDALNGLEPDEAIPFFCECNRDACFATVWMSGRAFDGVRATPGRTLNAHRATAHAPVLA
jgi:hypothetical protein